MNFSKDLLSFIDESSTAFHAVDVLEKRLLANNYIPLQESEAWDLKPQTAYFVSRAGGAIILFKTPNNWDSEAIYHIVGAHTDSPCLKLKNNPVSFKDGYQLLNVEVYGGVLINSWFDKDLLLGGKLVLENPDGSLQTELVRISKRLRIPRLAIHLDREVNKKGFVPNAQEHLFPVLGLGKDLDFNTWILQETGLQGRILSHDLFLFDAEASNFGGINEELIYAPRLDNLASVHASLSAMESVGFSDNTVQMAAYFQHEEIGSESQNGAGSNFLEATLKRLSQSVSDHSAHYYQTMAKSFFISADMAHAVHPNYASRHDAHHKPYLGKGPVIKSNANMRYATDAFAIARFKQWCHKAEVPYQDFCSRNDIGCGSTIGPMTAAKLGVPTIDIGNPMLSMHSIRELCSTIDHELIIEVFKEFYRAN